MTRANPPLPRLLRITRTGVWTRTRDEAAFHATFAVLHLTAVCLHLGAAVHHAALAVRTWWQR